MTEETVMAMPTQEQQKQVWEWCGFKYKPTKWLDDFHTRFEQEGWVYPDGTMGNSPETLFHLPPIDLNNLFKYAIPKLESVQLAKFADTRWHAIIQKGSLEDAVGDDPSLTLFWAIWKVISAEVKND